MMENNNVPHRKLLVNGTIKHMNGQSRNGFGDHIQVKETNNINSYNNENESRKVIGIEGHWYDITEFVHIHPGGSIIEHFIGKDASEVFRANGHNPEILNHRKVLGTYSTLKDCQPGKDFAELHKLFLEKGFFKTNYNFYLKNSVLCAIFLSACFSCVVFFKQAYMHYLGAVFLKLFWHQCGFMMHDVMHHQLFRNAFKDQSIGVFFGTFCFGVSAHWWQDEHFFHHALTNTVNVADKSADPQIWETVWAQNEKLFPLYNNILHHFFIRIQHITFIPFVVFLGRVGILVDSYSMERRWYEWVAIVGHWLWIAYLLSFLPTWKEIILFYTIASALEGMLHFQLVLSHYCRLFTNEEDLHNLSWTRYQVVSNMNIDCPPWMDWYWGGLNFHIEHHLYPKMARNRLREAAPYVKRVCQKHNIEYASLGFIAAMATTLKHLKKTGKHFTLDPR